MVKHTQAIRRQQPINCLSVLDHFVGLALKGLNLQKVSNRDGTAICEGRSLLKIFTQHNWILINQ